VRSTPGEQQTGDWRIAFATAVLCLTPILVFWSRFRSLYWFHDDWDMISEMQRMGLAAWTPRPFEGNFVPLFKSLWPAAILLAHGSYFGMVVLLWATHLCILFVFALLLRSFGFSWLAQTAAVLTLGMPWCNVETLGWATQWSSLLSTLFFLLACVLIAMNARLFWPAAAAVIYSFASAFSFPRGVLAGILVGFLAIVSSDSAKHRTRWLLSTAALSSATVIPVAVYRALSASNSFDFLQGGKIREIASYSIHYLLLNPLFHILPIPHKSVGLKSMLIAGTVKAFTIGAALFLARSKQRRLLWMLLLFDFGTAALLGIGRYDHGLETVISYRYQYASLLCYAPFLGIVIARAAEWIPRPGLGCTAFAVFVLAWGLLLAYPWRRYSARWSEWRGMEARAALASSPEDKRFGLPGITAGRARELIAIYHLH